MKKAGAPTVSEFRASKRSNPTGGVSGVHFPLVAKSQPNGKWEAMAKLPNGKRPSKGFSVARLGNGETSRLAVEAGKKQLREMVNDWPHLYNHTARRLSSQ